ncbi:hypothetical protein BUALT_Bualt18G0084400 [Buddleja alternifolia]|uniref:Uncharacterized protein n=1 Tax=Buddleja alternifolia TaxID=168488 RepID=A0AAV6W9N5_9LAMI|nr:hypothetical protein BUALT_Bualt18G0084400 [Buddleja alternifolia]
MPPYTTNWAGATYATLYHQLGCSSPIGGMRWHKLPLIPKVRGSTPPGNTLQARIACLKVGVRGLQALLGVGRVQRPAATWAPWVGSPGLAGLVGLVGGPLPNNTLESKIVGC